MKQLPSPHLSGQLWAGAVVFSSWTSQSFPKNFFYIKTTTSFLLFIYLETLYFYHKQPFKKYDYDLISMLEIKMFLE